MSTNSDSDANTRSSLIRGKGFVPEVSKINSKLEKLARQVCRVRPWNARGEVLYFFLWCWWPTIPSDLPVGQFYTWYAWNDYRIQTPLDRWNEFYWPTVPSYVKSGDAWRLHRLMPANKKRVSRQPVSNWRNNNPYDSDLEEDYIIINGHRLDYNDVIETVDLDVYDDESHSSMY